jgi:hypothetical protein
VYESVSVVSGSFGNVSDPGFEPGDEVKHTVLGQKNLNDFCRSRKIYKREKPCDVSAFLQGSHIETPITS